MSGELTPGLIKKFTGKQHHHACTSCRSRYVCACKAPARDQRCNPCISGFPSASQAAWAPRPCCAGSRKVTYAYQREAYRLAGTVTWWLCPTCARTHGHLPIPARTSHE